MDNVDIRKGRKEDINDIRNVIYESVMATHTELYPPKDIQETLDNYTEEKVNHYIQDYDYFVAVCDSKVVGCVLVKENKMRSLYVLPSFMRKGIGKKLVKEAEMCVKSNDYDDIFLWSSLVSHDFYIHMGYEDVREIENKEGLILHIEMRKKLF
ncbi:GNAT family N-acetyltransferase [Candidatus Dojkabacteria bacterium]|nr:GNAT family N-acetyltransferase [Candidatus Dojkabacteria bacterium]